MLAPESWVHHAKDVAPGQKRYFPHDCGGGKTLLISNNEGGYSAWCFRCSDSGWHRHPELPLAERIAKLQEQAAHDARHAFVRGDPTLPHGLVFDVQQWPSHAAVWLYKAGIGKPEIARLGAGWHPDMERVVLPVYEGKHLVYWQARGFDKGRPKYINPDVDKQQIIPTYGEGVRVLTEDILSAFKVGMAAKGTSLMGTSLSEKLLSTLLSERLPVLVWLDPDEAGQRAADKIVRQLRQFGLSTGRIVTDKDPKLLSQERINHEVHQARNEAGT